MTPGTIRAAIRNSALLCEAALRLRDYWVSKGDHERAELQAQFAQESAERAFRWSAKLGVR